MRLSVINSKPKIEQINYPLFYSRMLTNSLILANQSDFESFSSIDLDLRKKIIFAGVKTINSTKDLSKTYQELKKRFGMIDFINKIVSTMTPRQFQTVFPITKEYDGNRYETKDYFYTRNYIAEIGEDMPIGERITEFFWEYCNWDLRVYTVNTMSVMSDIRKFQGKGSILDEFFKGITTYTIHEGFKGKKFFINNKTGKSLGVKKPRPSYLKPVK